MNAPRKAGKRRAASAAKMVSHNDAARAKFRASIGSAEDLQKKAEAALRPELVDVYRAARRDISGVKLTRGQARNEMAQRQVEENARKAEAEREQLAKLEKSIAESAREDVADSLRGLLAVRDMLLSLEEGSTPYGLDSNVNAEIIGTFLMKHAAKLERALYQLRAWEGEKYGSRKAGGAPLFANDLLRVE